jgi:hypothetical protein
MAFPQKKQYSRTIPADPRCRTMNRWTTLVILQGCKASASPRSYYSLSCHLQTTDWRVVHKSVGLFHCKRTQDETCTLIPPSPCSHHSYHFPKTSPTLSCMISCTTGGGSIGRRSFSPNPHIRARSGCWHIFNSIARLAFSFVGAMFAAVAEMSGRVDSDCPFM